MYFWYLIGQYIFLLQNLAAKMTPPKKTHKKNKNKKQTIKNRKKHTHTQNPNKQSKQTKILKIKMKVRKENGHSLI